MASAYSPDWRWWGERSAEKWRVVFDTLALQLSAGIGRIANHRRVEREYGAAYSPVLGRFWGRSAEKWRVVFDTLELQLSAGTGRIANHRRVEREYGFSLLA